MKKVLFVLILTIVFCSCGNQNKEHKKYCLKSNDKTISIIPKIIKTDIGTTKTIEWFTFKITAYDLNYESCGKNPGDTGYGMTRYGINLSGHTYKTARIVAGDSNLYQYGTFIEIRFENNWREIYNGIYKVGDTGGAVKGKHFDLFLGENKESECYNFGVSYAKIRVVE